MLEAVRTPQDRMIVTWLANEGQPIGELCGLHLVDLHLRENAACGECKAPHLHVCHRWGNPNRAAAKIKPDWRMVNGVITGGEIYRASPAMISTYYTYMTTEYTQCAASHGMLLVQLAGPRRGEPWSADAARGMLRRAGYRADLPGRIKPQAFRHQMTSDVLDASGGDPMVAKAVGNWASVRWWTRSTGILTSTRPSSPRPWSPCGGAGVTATQPHLVVIPAPRTRTVSDRLEILQTLITGPGFDPLLRDDIIRVPRGHAVYGWGWGSRL